MRNQLVKLTAFVILFLVSVSVSAQVKGNGKIKTKTIELADFEKIDLKPYPNICKISDYEEFKLFLANLKSKELSNN